MPRVSNAQYVIIHKTSSNLNSQKWLHS